MTIVYVALLRGINVGGNRKVDMKQLKSTFERAGFEAVRTYINSGNVIFRSEERDVGRLSGVIESAIESAFGFPVKVLVRDRARIVRMLDSLPVEWVNDGDTKCDVLFLGDTVDTPEVLERLSFRPEMEDVVYADGAVIWRIDRKNATRSGMLRIVGTDLYAQMTVRNCNTARKLLALME